MNYFAELLQNPIFEVEEKRKKRTSKKPYAPKQTTIDKLLGDNLPLIDLINCVNPFAESLVYFEYSHREMAASIRKAFSIPTSVITPLDEENFQILLNIWEKGIKENISRHKDSIWSKEIENKEKILQKIFLDVLVSLTKSVIFDRSIPSCQKIIRSICVRAAEITSEINDNAKTVVTKYFEKAVHEDEVDISKIQQYKKTKYKVLDSNLSRALDGDFFSLSCSVFVKLDRYLLFTERTLESVMEDSKKVTRRFLDELLEAQKQYITSTEELKNTREFTEGASKEKYEIKRKLYRIERIFSERKWGTKRILESLSSLVNDSSENL